MSVPSLFSACCKTVAQCIRNEKFTEVDIEFPPKIGQLIFDELKLGKRRFRNVDVALSIAHQLKVTRLDFRERNGVSVEDKAFLSQQEHLEVLELGAIDRDPMLDQDDIGSATVEQDEKKFMEALNECLAEGSRSRMRHFGVETGGLNPARIVMEITRILPHLTSLNLNNCSLSPDDFTLIRTTYPQLTMLGFCMDRNFDIRGISSLTQLEHLSIGCSVLLESQGVFELLEMGSLQSLDVSIKDYSRRNPLFDELVRLMTADSFRGLRFLDLSGSWITREVHEEIAGKIPSLQQVVLINTPMRFMDPSLTFPIPRILNCADLELFMKSLDYMKGKDHHIVQMICKLGDTEDHPIYESNDIKLRNSLVRRICDLLPDIELSHYHRACFQISASEVLRNLLSSLHIRGLTELELKKLDEVYDLRKYPNTFWLFAETYWSLMRDFCLFGIFEQKSTHSVTDRAIGELSRPNDPRVTSAIFQFFHRLCKSYREIYLSLIRRLREKAKESMEFSNNYTEKGYDRDMLLFSTSDSIKTAEMRLLKAVILKVTEQPSFTWLEEKRVVAYLLDCSQATRLHRLGHYAFSVLLILQKYKEFQDPFHTSKFNKLKAKRPLRAKFVIEMNENVAELMQYVQPDRTHFSIV